MYLSFSLKHERGEKENRETKCSLSSYLAAIMLPSTWHMSASMSYSWVIHLLCVTTIHMSHHTSPTGYSSNHPW